MDILTAIATTGSVATYSMFFVMAYKSYKNS